MNHNPDHGAARGHLADNAPILIVPYMWIGDFVRCHTVVRLLQQRYPGRAIDILSTSMVAPLLDYMPGVRKGIVVDLPRKRLPLGQYRELAQKLRAEGYGQALIMPRTWKSALAPWLAGIPLRTGFAGEVRFGLLNDVRWGERALPRMIDRCGALTLPKGAKAPAEWPPPQLLVPAQQVADWRHRQGLSDSAGPIVAFAPGAVGWSKRWPAASYAELARRLAAEGADVWVLGGPGESAMAAEIAAVDPVRVRNLAGADLRNAILALAAADFAISNDSGLLHVAAAIGTPTIGIFGPTSPWHWAPLNPLAGVVQATTDLPCRPCHQPTCRLGHHRCMRDITVDRMAEAARSLFVAGRQHSA